VRLSEVGPVATAFHRIALSVPVFALLAARLGAPVGRAGWAGCGLAGLFFAGDLSVWHVGILLTSVANASLFTNTAPVFVTLGLWLVWRQRPSLRFVAALAVSLAGAALLMGGSLRFAPERLAGDGLSLLSGAFYGAYLVTVGRSRGWVAAPVLMLWSGVAASVILLPVSLALGETVLPRTASGWGVAIAVALVSQVAGQGLIAWGLAHVSAALGALVLLLQPVVAALLAWALFGEALGGVEILGGMVILLGIHIARKARVA
jgi:drug/metabolite transporter (DMT)-like permease